MALTSIKIDTLPHAEKLRKLVGIFDELKRVIVAYSGGVDSTLLLKVGTLTLGENCIGITARSETLTPEEYDDALRLARDHDFNIVTLEYSELDIENYAENPVNRCYFCKHELFDRIRQMARRMNVPAIAEGSNADDVDDWRPGLKAIQELQIASPLRQAGLRKSEIRDLARALGLPNWNKPSMPCLASRIAYGIQIDQRRLGQVADGERFLRQQGFRLVRVRHHDEIARIEVGPDEIDRLLDPALREAVAARLRELGFRYVTVDLAGYRTGSLNEAFHTMPAANG
ncbi:MAG: ATP-dependent sacrificial sulfur transferase LarE [bacterium]|nr:ATP-dependent sacrificial sulfur transferase LarE [bacterium]